MWNSAINEFNRVEELKSRFLTAQIGSMRLFCGE